MRSEIITLPLYLLSILQNATKSWNIVKIAFGKNNLNHKIINNENNTISKQDTDILKIFYPKGSYSPSKEIVGGIGFFASPQDIFMAEEVVFKYDVLFDKTFNPNRGGKLPGLFIGNGLKPSNMKGAAGGKHSNTASCRIAWRKNFDAEAYIYLPIKQQHLEYYNISGLVQNPIYGDSLWRGIFKFDPVNWNTISIRLKLNKININDGELEISINNITQKFDKLIWRTDNNYKINAIIFETFFGGSTIETSTPNDTWSYFKNVKIQRLN
jgi:hypothetical protein